VGEDDAWGVDRDESLDVVGEGGRLLRERRGAKTGETGAKDGGK
jgi:hypothetical protein